MTAAETRLENALQMCQLQADELEVKDSQEHQIVAMFEEREQRLEDTYNNTPDYTIKMAAYFKLQELRYLRREIERIQGQED